MNIKKLFGKKAICFIGWDKFQNQEAFRENLIFSQKARKDNIKNIKFGGC